LGGGSCNPLHNAAVLLGLVDALRGQMLSAVERVKQEVEHPLAASPGEGQVRWGCVWFHAQEERFLMGPNLKGFEVGGGTPSDPTT
jgi:hypothetical protein